MEKSKFLNNADEYSRRLAHQMELKNLADKLTAKVGGHFPGSRTFRYSIEVC